MFRFKRLQLSYQQMIALGFLGLILLGAVLLMLPFSSRSFSWTDPLSALFTATSAVCVTGLVVLDTATHWSVFGQLVLLVLIQIGGLGLMTVATLFSFALRRKVGPGGAAASFRRASRAFPSAAWCALPGASCWAR